MPFAPARIPSEHISLGGDVVEIEVGVFPSGMHPDAVVGPSPGGAMAPGCGALDHSRRRNGETDKSTVRKAPGGGGIPCVSSGVAGGTGTASNLVRLRRSPERLAAEEEDGEREVEMCGA